MSFGQGLIAVPTLWGKLFENPLSLFRWNRVLLTTTMRAARG